MKRYYLIPIAILCTFSASKLWAQPTLYARNNAPVIGDIFYYNFCDTTSITEGASGAGITWNFAGLHRLSSDTSWVMPCSTTPYCANFTGSDLTEYNNAVYSYYSSDTNSGMSLGNETSTNANHYTNAKGARWPLTYGRTDTNTYYSLGTSAAGADRYFDSTKCDAYGTLILPTGTYTNVLRTHLTNYAFPASGGSLKYEWFTWMVDGVHTSIFSMGFATFPTSARHIFYVAYRSVSTSTIVEAQKKNTSFTLFPNPTSNTITITANTRITNLQIFNPLGQVITCGNNTTTLDVSNLTPGLYYVKVNNEQMLKFIKE